MKKKLCESLRIISSKVKRSPLSQSYKVIKEIYSWFCSVGSFPSHRWYPGSRFKSQSGCSTWLFLIYLVAPFKYNLVLGWSISRKTFSPVINCLESQSQFSSKTVSKGVRSSKFGTSFVSMKNSIELNNLITHQLSVFGARSSKFGTSFVSMKNSIKLNNPSTQYLGCSKFKVRHIVHGHVHVHAHAH